jgi:hypothetical protein
MTDVQFTNDDFRPANERQAPMSADGGNERPTRDLLAVSLHNDKFGADERQYPGKSGLRGPGGDGRGPSQEADGDKRNPKPTLVAEPNYWGEMAPNTGSHPESGKAPGDIARRRRGAGAGGGAGGLVQQSPSIGNGWLEGVYASERPIPNPPGPSKDPATELAGPETLEE